MPFIELISLFQLTNHIGSCFIFFLVFLICICVCVCVCFRPPSCPVCPDNKVVEFQPRTVTEPDLGSDANSYTTYIPPAPPVSTAFWILFPLYQGLSPIAPSIFNLSTPLLSLYATTSTPPPPLIRSRSNHPPGRRPFLRASARHRSSALPSHSGQPKGVPHASLCLPSPIWLPPPCLPHPVPRSLSSPGFSSPGVPPSLCLPPSTSTPPPPPSTFRV